MTPADLMAIMSFSDGVHVLQDFTDDRDDLREDHRQAVRRRRRRDSTITDADDSSADTGTAFGEDDSEFNLFNTDRQLAALQTAAQMLGTLNEKKVLIYFASGLRLNGVDNQAQLQATTNAAIRANVSFYSIDARGLVAQAPLGDATRGSPGGLGMYTGGSAMAIANNFQQSQDTLYALAADTGGKALLDNNDLSVGIVQAEQVDSSYYIIGYYSANQALDGKFRRIKITYNGDTSAKLDYRQGYCAGKEFGKFTAADKERQLQDALMLGDPITELTIAMEVDYFQLNRAEYYVPVVMKIPGSELALARRGGAEHTLIDFIGEVKDEYGATMANVRDKVDIKLSGETAAQLARQPIQYDTGFTLLPGTYTFKVLARDDETGQHRNLHQEVRHPQPEQGAEADSHQLGGAERPARGPEGRAVQRGQGQRAGGQSADSGRAEADSQRDARVQQEPRHVRVPAGLRARRDGRAAAGGLRDLLPRADQGVRDAAAGGDGRDGPEVESAAAAFQPGAEQAAAGPVRLPGDAWWTRAARRRPSGRRR